MNTVRERIRHCYRQSGYTQAALAKKLGVVRDTIGNWVRGKTSPNEAESKILAELFGVSHEWLKTGQEPVPAAQASQKTPAEKVPGYLLDPKTRLTASQKKTLANQLYRLQKENKRLKALLAHYLEKETGEE